MRPGIRAGFGGVLLLASVAGGLFAASGTAGATTSVTLYVRVGATGSFCTGTTRTEACPSVGLAVQVAQSTYRGGNVAIDVGAGIYTTVGIQVTPGLASLTIEGAGAGPTGSILDGENRGSIFDIFSGAGQTITIEGLTVSYGREIEGGGAFIESPRVTPAPHITLSHDTFTTDSAEAGGGVFAAGAPSDLVLSDDTFSSDHAGDGGAVLLTETGASFSDDTFTQDSSTQSGGAILSFQSTAEVTNSTFVDDESEEGGALYGILSDAYIVDTTIATDSAFIAGGGIFTSDGDMGLYASILSNATCAVTGYVTTAFDVETGDTCGLRTTSVNTSTTIGLHSLAPNTSSGPETMAIGETSSAFARIPLEDCEIVDTDERGAPRPGVVGKDCDIGAYEYQQPGTADACPEAASSCGSGSSRPGQAVTAKSGDVKVTGTGGRGTVGIGTYKHDPLAALASSSGKFFALSLSTGNTLKSVVVTVCGVGSGTTVEWWNGTKWVRVVATSGGSTGPDGTCISYTFGPSTTPSLAAINRLSRTSRLRGVVFGVAR